MRHTPSLPTFLVVMKEEPTVGNPMKTQTPTDLWIFHYLHKASQGNNHSLVMGHTKSRPSVSPLATCFAVVFTGTMIISNASFGPPMNTTRTFEKEDEIGWKRK